MAVISGQRTTGNVASGQRAIDLSKTILLLEPSEAPLTVLLKQVMSGGLKKKTVNPEFKWSEDERANRWDAVNNGGGYNDSATSIDVDTGDRFYKDALVKVPRTGETMRVSSVATNTLTVERGFAGTSKAGVNDDEPLFIMGTASDEGSRSRDPRSENPAFVSNYTQIFKNTVAASETWRSSANETEPHDWDHQKKKEHMEHLLNLEFAGLFGTPSEASGDDGPIRTTGGAYHFLTANALGVGGNLTEPVFEQWCAEKVFKYGSKKKTAFLSPFVISVINTFARGKLQTEVGQKTYGVQVTEYITPHGVLKMVPHPMLEGAVYGRGGFVLDFKDGNNAYRFLSGGPGGSRDTKVLTDRQESDRDGKRDEIITEAGFQFGQPKTGATISGVTG